MTFVDGRASIAVAGLVVACSSAPAPTPRPESPAPIANTAPAGAATLAAPAPLVGRWRVVGCETSPQDPADCARGEIVFTAERVTIGVGEREHVSRPYRLVSRAADRVVLDVDGQVSEIRLDPKGAATWRAPGLGGRVGRLSFVRDDGSR